MKTFTKFRTELKERFLTLSDCRHAYAEGVKDGSIGKCPKCGSPNLTGRIAPDFESRKCVDCGKVSDKWRINEKLESDDLSPVQFAALAYEDEDRSGDAEEGLEEDEGGAPTNNAGSGHIAGIGVGPQGEPGVTPNYQRKRKQLKLMNGPAVDPRLFADKIFSRNPNKLTK
jgi:hypothetical protein